MSRVWRILKSYLFWTYDRGSFHYDVMVTLVLIFIFAAPHFVNFKDKPAEQPKHQNEVVIAPDGSQDFIYQADASAADAQDDAMVRTNFMRVTRPIAGAAAIPNAEPSRDHDGQLLHDH